MLSGDNGVLKQAGNAKTQTDIAGEKEIIDLAVAHAMDKSKYGDILKYLQCVFKYPHDSLTWFSCWRTIKSCI